MDDDVVLSSVDSKFINDYMLPSVGKKKKKKKNRNKNLGNLYSNIVGFTV